ncbi:MAG TPA: class D sortase [Blastocatellia bacterium]|nr:class D sortase [Blastocatellia bacterium]
MSAIIAIGPTGAAAVRRALRAAYFVFLAVGTVALGYAVYRWFDVYCYQRVTTSRFEKVRDEIPATRTIEEAPVSLGEVIGEIDLPRLGMKATVVQGDSEFLLRRAVGHLPDTALPGHAGNVALAAHRDGLFRPLRNVRPGDAILLRTRDRQIEYEVEWTAVVPPANTQVIEPTREPALTLVTCFPFYYVGAAPSRFIVRAREVPYGTYAALPAETAPQGK